MEYFSLEGPVTIWVVGIGPGPVLTGSLRGSECAGPSREIHEVLSGPTDQGTHHHRKQPRQAQGSEEASWKR